MLKLHEIPIVVISNPTCATADAKAGSSNSLVLALLTEIEAKLERLVLEGLDSTIDVRWLIGMPSEFELLRETLGRGEVSASIADIGGSLVQETVLPCVWWVSHRDRDGRQLGEFLEITDIPELLRSDRTAIPRGMAELRARRALLETQQAFPSIS